MESTDRVVLSTLTEGLGLCTVEELKKLLKLLPGVEQRPTRKADFVKTIAKYLKGDGLKTIWDSLDELQKAVVAEAVYVSLRSGTV